jgi:outer membrane lipoprotein-sorting protein
MTSLLRRLPLPRLIALCAATVAFGVGGAAIASAVDTGKLPEPKPLPQAIHDALAAAPVEGVSAQIQYTNHLLEGANLAGGAGGGGGLASSPLLQGASGRLWVAKDGRVRLELQADKEDTEVVLANHTLTIYGAAPNTVYRYTLPQHEASAESGPTGTSSTHYGGSIPSVAKLEEALARIEKHLNVEGATPANVAGQPAYTARVSPKEGGSLLGGAELSWDAEHGVPLRAAIYSSHSAAPVIELTATDISYGPVASSIFELTPPEGAKVVEPKPGDHESSGAPPSGSADTQDRPHVQSIGQGITSVLALEMKASGSESSESEVPGTQKVDINGAVGHELPTALGTLLTFESGGVEHLLAGAVEPPAVEAAARGL